MNTLQAIDARIAKYRALIDELSALRAEVVAALPAVETLDPPAALPMKPVLAPKSVPPGNAPRAAPVKRGPRTDGNLRDERRLRTARMLAAESLTTDQIAARLSIARSQVHTLTAKHPWFHKPPGHRAPWTLTAEGRAALAAQPERTTS